MEDLQEVWPQPYALAYDERMGRKMGSGESLEVVPSSVVCLGHQLHLVSEPVWLPSSDDGLVGIDSPPGKHLMSRRSRRVDGAWVLCLFCSTLGLSLDSWRWATKYLL